MKKSYRTSALVGVLALGVAGCGEAPAETPGGGGASSGESSGASSDYLGCMVSDAGGFNDQSFNQSGLEGLEAAVDELGVQQQIAESASESDYSTNIDALVGGGCNQIISVGFLLADATAEAASANPDTNFALVDAAVDPPQDNVKPLLFDTAQAAFLAGYAAAATSATGTVATYGGIKIPSVTVFMDGFVDGVAHHNSEKGTDVQVLGWDKAAQDGQFTGDFEDAQKGRNTTQNFLDAGADVILPVAGPVGVGTLAAARDAKTAGSDVKVIWVDADGYNTQPDFADLILTSVVKEIGAAVQDSIAADVDGSYTAEPYVGTLENGGVSLAPFHDFEASLPAGLTEELTAIQEGIVAGDIVVESPSTP
ncbi:MAG: ABC transporter, substrate-binding protein (cluster 11, riboflavin/purine nucleoside/unknown) [uncultured Quadrisphaera sp.]|uniref:ABC transporter substrate-binding protein PnrA-like domain-containing protein n=1 Tax=uncultured Quadrisphaera sp. TaxID=904978 RepID=A0A6J4PG41_9ACTN|nr:MAG: ABC transporter, substrate-binding protein (cluster 11, riboflavin/purine nucleoside/unknown) [uncultured Quadrisphaera sp.]